MVEAAIQEAVERAIAKVAINPYESRTDATAGCGDYLPPW
jgi:hypothetical protein